MGHDISAAERKETYRVHDNILGGVVCQYFRHGVRRLLGTQHANLHGILANILHADIDLPRHELRRNVVDIMHSGSILSRQRRGGGHGVASMSGNGLLVRFQAAGSDFVKVSLTFQTRITIPPEDPVIGGPGV